MLVIIELFPLAVTAEVLRAKIDWKSAFRRNGVNLTENIRNKGSSPPTILLWEN